MPGNNTYILRALMFVGALSIVAFSTSDALCVTITTKPYVDNNVASCVKNTGNETIQGQKTFQENPIVPTPPLP